MSGLIHGFRRTFFAGLAITIPIVVTILIFKIMFQTIDNFLGPLVTRLLLAAGAPIPQDFQVPGLGIITTIVIVFMAGVLTKNYFGKKLIELSEWIVDQIPVIRTVYTGAKQVMNAISTAGNQSFSKVVLVEFPRKGVFCLAFLTGSASGEVQERTKEDIVNIFLPTTPNPTSGFFIMVPRQDVIELEMEVEDGVKMLVSGGLVTPGFIPPKGGVTQVSAYRDPGASLADSVDSAEG